MGSRGESHRAMRNPANRSAVQRPPPLPAFSHPLPSGPGWGDCQPFGMPPALSSTLLLTLLMTVGAGVLPRGASKDRHHCCGCSTHLGRRWRARRSQFGGLQQNGVLAG